VANTIQGRLDAIAPLPLRLMLGFGFLFHGYPRLFTAEGHDEFASILTGLGAAAPSVSAYVIGAIEFFGGILLILGVAVRVVSTLGIADMLVAAIVVHAPAGFDFMNVTGATETGAMEFGLPGYEVNLLYIAGFLTLMLTGAGPISVPPVDRPRPWGGRPVPEPEAERRPEPELTHATDDVGA